MLSVVGQKGLEIYHSRFGGTRWGLKTCEDLHHQTIGSEQPKGVPWCQAPNFGDFPILYPDYPCKPANHVLSSHSAATILSGQFMINYKSLT